MGPLRGDRRKGYRGSFAKRAETFLRGAQVLRGAGRGPFLPLLQEQVTDGVRKGLVVDVVMHLDEFDGRVEVLPNGVEQRGDINAVPLAALLEVVVEAVE